MDNGSLSLILGTVIALGALSYVLMPLLASDEDTRAAVARTVRDSAAVRAGVPDEGLAVTALREIEFDRETGKLSDIDYEELKAKYTQLALSERPLAAGDQLVAAAPLFAVVGEAADPLEDPVEAAVRAVQARRPKCPTCGPRPESDATYCSGCGHYLPGACGSCGTSVEMPGARFCNGCGAQLAA
jgi:hypothetical protein